MKAVCLLTGPNITFREQALRRMLQGVDSSDISTYYAEEADLGQVFSQCYQNSLFGSANIVVLRRAEDIKDKVRKDSLKKMLENYLDQVNPSATLILEWEKPPASLEKKVSGHSQAEIKEFRKVYQTDSLAAYIREELSARGVSIDKDAAELVIQLCNSDLEQIAGYTRLLAEGNAGRLDYAAVRDSLSRARNRSVFDLVDACMVQDRNTVLEALSDLRLAGESVIALNNMLLRTARLLWAVLATPRDPDLYSKLSISPFEFKKLKGISSRSSLRHLSRVLEVVARVEILSKTAPEEFAWLELECFALSWKSGS